MGNSHRCTAVAIFRVSGTWPIEVSNTAWGEKFTKEGAGLRTRSKEKKSKRSSLSDLTDAKPETFKMRL